MSTVLKLDLYWINHYVQATLSEQMFSFSTRLGTFLYFDQNIYKIDILALWKFLFFQLVALLKVLYYTAAFACNLIFCHTWKDNSTFLWFVPPLFLSGTFIAAAYISSYQLIFYQFLRPVALILLCKARSSFSDAFLDASVKFPAYFATKGNGRHVCRKKANKKVFITQKCTLFVKTDHLLWKRPVNTLGHHLQVRSRSRCTILFGKKNFPCFTFFLLWSALNWTSLPC